MSYVIPPPAPVSVDEIELVVAIGKAFDQSAPIGPLMPKARTGELTTGAIAGLGTLKVAVR